ncbi:MAG TPA: hypothetical protein VMW58_00285 [Anaerolineae bacterium]|nr:hypothetical protein [Anaerolineae bacterium]
MDDEDFGYNPVLPRDIRPIFMWLCQEVASLYLKWQFYNGLYVGEGSTGLLSDLASGSFAIIEESLRRDMATSICRLCDPPRTGRQLNLSLQTLAEKCQELDGLPELLREYLDACQPVLQYRHKLVAHRDLNTTLSPQDNPLAPIGRTQIVTILDLAGRVLNLVYRHFTAMELAFTPSLIGGADTLLYWLSVAKKAKETGIPPAADRFR